MKAVVAALTLGLVLLIGGFAITLAAAQSAQHTADVAVERVQREQERADYRLCVVAKQNREALALLVGVIPEPFRAPYTAKLSPPITCKRP